MKPIKKITVSIHLGGQAAGVGELVQDGRQIFFKYFPNFIEKGIEISPFKLKLSDTIYCAEEKPFDGLFGVFADSLPDGWGHLLLDRMLTARGESLHDIGPLDRLAYIGNNGMGALMYEPSMESNIELVQFELDAIGHEMNLVLQGNKSVELDQLYNLGGSSGGARPKILIAYNPNTRQLMHSLKQLPTGYEDWLIKFPSSSDPRDIAQIEFAYHKMALKAGIEMSECKLFKGKSGQAYFGTKRFDRAEGNRLHLHSAAGLMHDNFRLSNLDYGHIMNCAFHLEKHVIAYEKILRLAAFNVLAHNRDDHSKNFSFLMDPRGNWTLAPAYDLTFSNSSHGLHSTMVSGESKNPTKKNLMQLADYFKIKKAKEIIQQVEEAISKWKYFANASSVGKESQQRIAKVLLEK